VYKPHGFATIVDPGHATQEYDTVQCAHCQRIIFTKPLTLSTVYLIPTPIPGHYHEEPGAGCSICHAPVCLPCHDRGTCMPFEQQLDLYEKGLIPVLGR
jgi:hypothetical protein